MEETPANKNLSQVFKKWIRFDTKYSFQIYKM